VKSISRIPGQGIENTEQKNPWDIAFYVYQEFWQAEGDNLAVVPGVRLVMDF
jgi:hypothetical protein